MLNHDWQYVPLKESKTLHTIGLMQGTTQCAWLHEPDDSYNLYNVQLQNKAHWCLGGSAYDYSAYSVAELHMILQDEDFSIDLQLGDKIWEATYKFRDNKLTAIGNTEAQTLAMIIIAAKRSIDPFINSRLNSRIRKLFYDHNQ